MIHYSNPPQTSQKKLLKLFYTNIDTVTNKLPELKLTTTAEEYDVLCICELTPKNSTTPLEDDHIMIPGYRLFSNLSTHPRRGVAVYVKDVLQVRDLTLNHDYSPWVESVFVNIVIGGKPLLIGCVYRSPSSPDAAASYGALTQLADHASKHCNQDFILIGDLNMPDILWVDGAGYHQSSTATNPFVEYLGNNNLYQLIDQPTRYKNNQIPSLLDLTITNNPGLLVNTDYLPPIGASDHLCISHDLLISQPPNNCTKRTYTDYSGVREILQAVAWDQVTNSDDIEQAWLNFKNAVLHVEQLCTSTSFVKAPRTLPHIDRPIKRAMNRKKKALSKYKKCVCTRHWEHYARARNKLRHLTRHFMAEYEEKIAFSIKENPKRFWRYVSKKDKNRRSIPFLFNAEGKKLEDPEAIANLLNTTFASNFSSDSSAEPSCPDPRHIEHLMPKLIITTEEVKKRLSKLDPNKAKGPDGIHPRLLKEISDIVTEPLCSLYNLSLKTKKLPPDWRTATITPIFKKGSRSQPENYRPISLTSVVAKLIEGIVNDAVIAHMTRNGLLYSGQHGFRKGMSIETNLIQAYESITEVIESGSPVDVFLLDQAKAFDKMSHRYLMIKLSAYHIDVDVAQWIHSFLSDRIQMAAVYDHNGNLVYSAPVNVRSGVPQGTKLGPTLFNLYINDAPEVVQNLLELYADDSKLFGPAASDEDCNALQQDLTNLCQWASTWTLEFNPSKCKVLHLGLNNPCHSYHMLDSTGAITPIQSAEEERDLGVIIDNKLKFHSHCRTQAAKANKILGLIKRSVTSRHPRVIKKLYTALVRPHLEFGMAVANPHFKCDAELLEKVQRRATRLPFANQQIPYEQRLEKLDLQTLTYRRKRGDVILAYKLMNSSVIKPILEQDQSSRARGNPIKLRQRFSRKREKYNFFTNRVVPLWNSLSDSTVSAASVNSFKTGVDHDWRNKPWRTQWDEPASTTRVY